MRGSSAPHNFADCLTVDLIKIARLCNALQFVTTTRFELEPGAGHQVTHGARGPDLAGAGQGADSGRDVYCDSFQPAASTFDLARMQADPLGSRGPAGCAPRFEARPR
jgi:hypothetical protein